MKEAFFSSGQMKMSSQPEIDGPPLYLHFLVKRTLRVLIVTEFNSWRCNVFGSESIYYYDFLAPHYYLNLAFVMVGSGILFDPVWSA